MDILTHTLSGVAVATVVANYNQASSFHGLHIHEVGDCSIGNNPKLSQARTFIV